MSAHEEREGACPGAGALACDIALQLTMAQHALAQQLACRLSPLSLTPGEFNIMRLLWAGEEATPKFLAESLDYNSATVSNYLRQLQGKGLIARELKPGDRRCTTIAVTPSGEACRARAERAAAEACAAALCGLPNTQRSGLLQILRTINGQRSGW